MNSETHWSVSSRSSTSPNCDATSPYRVHATGQIQLYHLHHTGIIWDDSNQIPIILFTCMESRIKLKDPTYRTRDDESREKIPHWIKSEGDDGGDILIWWQSYCHHSVKSEVQKCEIHEEQIPEEFSNCPFESNHCIYCNAIYNCLYHDIWQFNCNLWKQDMSSSDWWLTPSKIKILFCIGNLLVRMHMGKLNTFLLPSLDKRQSFQLRPLVAQMQHFERQWTLQRHTWSPLHWTNPVASLCDETYL